MTNREFYQNVIDLISVNDDSPATCVDTDALLAKAQELIAKLDASNAKRTSADSKAKQETAARREAVFAALSEAPQTAAEIAAKVGVTEGQASSALTFFFKNDQCDKTEVKVGKSRKMAYSLRVSE